jgi:hypothetical protein
MFYHINWIQYEFATASESQAEDNQITPDCWSTSELVALIVQNNGPELVTR